MMSDMHGGSDCVDRMVRQNMELRGTPTGAPGNTGKPGLVKNDRMVCIVPTVSRNPAIKPLNAFE